MTSDFDTIRAALDYANKYRTIGPDRQFRVALAALSRVESDAVRQSALNAIAKEAERDNDDLGAVVVQMEERAERAERRSNSQIVMDTLVAAGYDLYPDDPVFPAFASLLRDNTELRAAAEQGEKALTMALDCKGSFGGLVSEVGGEPAICRACGTTIRAALSLLRGKDTR